MFEERRNFLGFDFSTQKLKALVIGDDYEVLHEADVDFDSDLPEFRTSGGVLKVAGGQGVEVTAPPLLWVKALDMVLDRLVLAGADFSAIRAVSGAAQQHGSVWWTKGSEDKLRSLSPEDFLHTQLASAFVMHAPVWMDSSTTEHCRALEEAVGGAQVLAKVTGSTAYERFTGAQIRKTYVTKRRLYEATERIALVSNFACSLLLGTYAPLDLSDASGMNLLDIENKEWYEPALKACGDDTLKAKLGGVVPSATLLGSVSGYYVKRYGFRGDCQVVAFTGDNPSALAGLRLRSGWVGLSLGTSDTLFLGLEKPSAPPAGHVMVGPTPQAPYFAMLVFSNGSLTRQRHRDRLVGPSWDKFDEAVRSTVRGNLGHIGIYYDVPEIVPRVQSGRWLWDASGRPVDKMAAEYEARALLETQAVARRAHAEDMGFHIGGNSKIIATGGAAANKELLQIFADVFNAPVYVQKQHGNAALLGAAIRAADAWSESASVTLNGSGEDALEAAATPYPDADRIYSPLVERYRNLVATLPALQ